jgi:excisionase family DNA binding protein
MKESYRLDELAAIWDCSTRTVRRLIASGKLKAFKVGHHWRITAEERFKYQDLVSTADSADIHHN